MISLFSPPKEFTVGGSCSETVWGSKQSSCFCNVNISTGVFPTKLFERMRRL